MQHVRLPLISREFLTTHVDDEPLIRDTPQCKDYLIEAMKYHLLPEKRACMTSIRTRERAAEGAKSYIYAVGMSLRWSSDVLIKIKRNHYGIHLVFICD